MAFPEPSQSPQTWCHECAGRSNKEVVEVTLGAPELIARELMEAGPVGVPTNPIDGKLLVCAACARGLLANPETTAATLAAVLSEGMAMKKRLVELEKKLVPLEVHRDELLRRVTQLEVQVEALRAVARQGG